MRPRYYTLSPTHEPIPCDVLALKEPQNESEWRVGHTWVGTARVSTVFLQIDHGHNDRDDPVLFETMVFNGVGEWDDYQERYCTWDEAASGHARIVEQLRELEPVYKAVKEARRERH